ncbi:glycosyltransferase [Saccharolobus islandicus]|uniref:Glycosyl transferase, group 1 n=1 Tax=Saccharolobus islandicus (strain L.D.8.5 / Lassen \|nr:glycosyltransferase [Sulfolobus islandicus]ADB86816.1 glycosyl transferase, group 1 [Sulfolobus islandicus L.D.8.5]
MSDKIAVLVNIESIIQEWGGGGIEIERAIISRLANRDDILIVPKVDTLISKNKDLIWKIIKENKLSNILILDNNSTLPKTLLKTTLNELKRRNVKYVLDLNYWPLSYMQLNLQRRNSLPFLYLLGEAYYYSKGLGSKMGVMLQGVGLNENILGVPKVILRYIKNKNRETLPIDVFINNRNKIMYLIYKGLRERFISIFLKHSRAINRIYGLSYGQLKVLHLHDINKSYVVEPAMPDSVSNLRGLKFRKRDYLVFYARLIPLKGILEIPFIMKRLIEFTDLKEIKIYVIGKFPNTDVKNIFFKTVQDLKLEDNVIYKGFLYGDELYKIIAQAKCTLYPSHEDSFSLAILESVALRTPVVAYDILPLRSVYGNLSSVILVKEFDINGMALQVSRILRLNEDKYNEIVYSESVDNFIEKHSNWDDVVNKLYIDLLRISKIR